jgi:hypothetical protein
MWKGEIKEKNCNKKREKGKRLEQRQVCKIWVICGKKTAILSREKYDFLEGNNFQCSENTER